MGTNFRGVTGRLLDLHSESDLVKYNKDGTVWIGMENILTKGGVIDMNTEVILLKELKLSIIEIGLVYDDDKFVYLYYQDQCGTQGMLPLLLDPRNKDFDWAIISQDYIEHLFTERVMMRMIAGA